MKQAAQQIASASNILICCHVAPDGDAIGSLLGLGLALRQTGRRVTMSCSDPVPQSCRHLPHWEAITQSPGYANLDLVISLDCGDLERLGSVYNAEALAGVPIANIDHHATNTRFGQTNWVDTQAAATAQMLVYLIEELGIFFSIDVATCLLNGILTDTLGFRTANTTAEVMDTATKLMRAGAPLTSLTDSIYNRRPMSVVQMWSAALQDMHLEGRIIWSQITLELRQRVGYNENGSSGLVSFLCSVDEVDIAVIFEEAENGQVNVSMRAAPGFSVSQIAFVLGGGGHPQAAGCSIHAAMPEAREQVLSLLRQAWQEQRLTRANGDI
ncbi:MAG: bifunctional oligoribonuclease/PAP phosphatase NrnA [Anaerolineae bacterium]|nr:bifunctional oligoribonuclease/PAP phosphatase NrnA [Anaerolineae bacterium]